MVTVQYTYQNRIESQRLALDDALELSKALKSKGISCQIVT